MVLAFLPPRVAARVALASSLEAAASCFVAGPFAVAVDVALATCLLTIVRYYFMECVWCVTGSQKA